MKLVIFFSLSTLASTQVPTVTNLKWFLGEATILHEAEIRVGMMMVEVNLILFRVYHTDNKFPAYSRSSSQI